MVLRKLVRHWRWDVSPLGHSFCTSLWPEPDEPERFGGQQTQGRRWSLLFGALLSGDILLVPIHFHVRGVDQADVLMMGI